MIGFASAASASDGSGVSGNGEEMMMAAMHEAETDIDARFDGNEFDFKIETKFESGKTDVHALLKKVLHKLQLSKPEIAEALEVKDAGELDADVDDVDMEKKLEVKIDIDTEEGMSTVEAKLEFNGMADSKKEAVKAIFKKLSALTVHDIHDALELTME